MKFSQLNHENCAKELVNVGVRNFVGFEFRKGVFPLIVLQTRIFVDDILRQVFAVSITVELFTSRNSKEIKNK